MVAAIDMEETMISATTRRNLRLQAKEEGRSCDPEALASAKINVQLHGRMSAPKGT
jgi:hypothetical protein